MALPKPILLAGSLWYLFSPLIPGVRAQFVQQGNKLIGSGAVDAGGSNYGVFQGRSVAVSADGNTAIVGGPQDNGGAGAVWVFTRANGAWTQQGNKLVGSGAAGSASLGYSVALSADGNTALAGGFADANMLGAVWVFTRSNGTWTQQGGKLVGSGAVDAGGSYAYVGQGTSVALSADGNTAIVGGSRDNSYTGAVWIFTRTNGTWTQQGNKLVGTGAAVRAAQGISVALSADGNTALVGGSLDNSYAGAMWVFTRAGGAWTQQGSKLVGTGATGAAAQASGVAISADGNTAIEVGDVYELGGIWVFTRAGGVWTQQGATLRGTGASGNAAFSTVALSADGNTAVIGGYGDNSGAGAVWVFTHSNGTWTQQGNKLVGSSGVGHSGQGGSVALSADAGTLIEGGGNDNSFLGAAWVFAQPVATHFAVSAPSSAAAGTAVNFTVTALDANNNPLSGYLGTVAFSSTDAAAALPANAPLLHGAGTFSATLNSPGSQSITATDIAVPFLTGTSGAIVVGPGAATRFVVSAPSSATAGAAFNFTVTANDAFGNTATGYNGTVRFTSTDSAAALPGSATLASGAGTFTATLKTAGSQSITATDTVMPSLTGTSTAIAVSGAVPPPGTPTVMSLSPVVSAGRVASFVFQFSDTAGWQNLSVVNVLVNKFLDGRQACYIAYSVPDNVLYLVPDSGGGLLPGLALNGSGSTSNSQCTVSGAGSSASGSGNTLTLTLNLAFYATFGGNQVVYMAARDAGSNSGWQTMGAHGVPPLPSTFPDAVSMSPSSGSSLTTTVTFTYQDQTDAANLQTVWALINTAIDGRAACYVAYYRPGNQLYLYPDNGDGAAATNIALTGNNSIANSQCTISAQGSLVQTSGNTLTVTLPIAFKPAFAGFKGVWLAAQTMGAAATCDWQALGAEAVPGQ